MSSMLVMTLPVYVRSSYRHRSQQNGRGYCVWKLQEYIKNQSSCLGNQTCQKLFSLVTNIAPNWWWCDVYQFQFSIFHWTKKSKRMGLEAIKLIESLFPKKITIYTGSFEHQYAKSDHNTIHWAHGHFCCVPQRQQCWEISSHMVSPLLPVLRIDERKELWGI